MKDYTIDDIVGDIEVLHIKVLTQVLNEQSKKQDEEKE